jgi:hypothetical protein
VAGASIDWTGVFAELAGHALSDGYRVLHLGHFQAGGWSGAAGSRA